MIERASESLCVYDGEGERERQRGPPGASEGERERVSEGHEGVRVKG